jgi:LmbE family N-acetylglucosaminyl deacetylase
VRAAGAFLEDFRNLPFAGLDDIVGPRRPLVLAPHPDDESLGCGGLIAACCARATPPLVVIATDGVGSHPLSRTHPAPVLRRVREQEARDAVAILGGDPRQVAFLGLPDTAAPRDGEVFDRAVAAIVGLARVAGCETILAPWRHDPHCDHEAADELARVAARRATLLHLSYPVWGWTLPAETVLADAPVHGWRFDIASDRARKDAAIRAHESQYGGLISDDPTGFVLPKNLLDAFARDYEVFFHA